MIDLEKFFEQCRVDVSATMERFMGNQVLYAKCLGMMFEDKTMEHLTKAMGEGDMEAAFAEAHTLKGVSGNMGITPLYQAVCALVEALRNKESKAACLMLYQPVLTEFQRVEEIWRQLA